MGRRSLVQCKRLGITKNDLRLLLSENNRPFSTRELRVDEFARELIVVRSAQNLQELIAYSAVAFAYKFWDGLKSEVYIIRERKVWTTNAVRRELDRRGSMLEVLVHLNADGVVPASEVSVRPRPKYKHDFSRRGFKEIPLEAYLFIQHKAFDKLQEKYRNQLDLSVYHGQLEKAVKRKYPVQEQNTVTLLVDESTEMARVEFNGKTVHEGNFWDFHPRNSGSNMCMYLALKYGHWYGYQYLGLHLAQYVKDQGKVCETIARAYDWNKEMRIN